MTMVVTIPGAWHGAWALDAFNAALEARGVRAMALTMPSLGGGPDRRGIPADVEATRAALDALDEDVVLAGHSYAGIVITEAGAHPRVKQLVYLCAFMPEGDESANSLMSGPVVAAAGEETLLPAMRQNADPALIDLAPEIAKRRLYNDCSAAAADAAAARLEPHVAAVFNQSPQAVAWREKPSLYVICNRDRAIPPALQRVMARRATRSLSLDASHSPFLSMPAQLTDVVLANIRP